MRHQRLAAVALAALMMLAAAGVQADAEGRIVQSSCSIVPSGEYYLVYCYAQVHNDSNEVICLERGTFQLHNGEQSLVSSEISQLWPPFIAPGDDGYYFDVVTFEPDEGGSAALPAVSGIDYNAVYAAVDPEFASYDLSVISSVEQDDAGQLTVVCELTNNTDLLALEPTVAFGLYTDGGAMVYADGRLLQGIAIPAGNTMVVRFCVDSALVKQWKQYGANITEARANAAFRVDED